MENFLLLATCHDFVVGGISTYFFRIFKWASENNIQYCLVLRRDSLIEDSMRKELQSLNVKIIRYAMIKDDFIKKDAFFDFKKYHYILVTPDLHCFYKFSRIKSKYDMSVFLYILHPQASRICENKIVNFPYSKFLINQLDSSVLFMDKECKSSCEDYYNIHFSSDVYYRIGMKLPEFSETIVENRTKFRNENFNILTITRMDFPFKGYVLGLVDDFIKFLNVHNDASLTIIGDGKDFNVLAKKISVLPEIIKRRISIHNYVPYAKLSSYFEKASVYVGMGTTLLDASALSTPSIIATAYQRENLSVGLFTDEFDNIGGNLNFSEKKYFYEELIKVYELNDNDYVNLQKNMYKTVLLNYEINEVMNKILAKHKENHSFLCRGNYFLKIYDFLIIYYKKCLHKIRGDIK